MCVFSAPKIPVPPPVAQFQATQNPKDLVQGRTQSNLLSRRRGMWASIMTSPSGISGPPTVTGGAGSATGA